MSTHCCSGVETKPGMRVIPPDSPPATSVRRGRRTAEWIVPSVGLALLPKCPMCIVAYIAFTTGIGISVTAATRLREAAVVLLVSALVFFCLRRMAHALTRLRKA